VLVGGYVYSCGILYLLIIYFAIGVCWVVGMVLLCRY